MGRWKAAMGRWKAAIGGWKAAMGRWKAAIEGWRGCHRKVEGLAANLSYFTGLGSEASLRHGHCFASHTQENTHLHQILHTVHYTDAHLYVQT